MPPNVESSMRLNSSRSEGSGGKSMMRRIVPPSGGEMPWCPAVLSFALIRAGVSVVRQTLTARYPGRPETERMEVAGASSRMRERPFASSAVTMRRISGRFMGGFLREHLKSALYSGFAARLAGRLPFYYGWMVLACLCLAGFSRQGPAVATLSIFIDPLTREFGWSRTALSGAVSLGGVLAALLSPLVGPLLDRHGSRVVLCAAVLVNATALVLLSFTPSLLVFYLLFCIARMNWAVPFDLGIYGALANRFVERRAFATSIATMAQMAGLVAMPLIAQFAIVHDGWRAGWLALGIVTLVAGFVPVWLFIEARPPERSLASTAAPEPSFSRRQ